MKECCKNCRYFHELKINKRKWQTSGIKIYNNAFDVSGCCVVFPKMPNAEYDSFVLEVSENDMCEMFTPR